MVSSRSSTAMMGMWFLYGYLALFWAPMALIAARMGKFTSLVWRPFLPMLPALWFFRNAPARLRTLVQLIHKEWKVAGVIIAIVGCIAAIQVVNEWTGGKLGVFLRDLVFICAAGICAFSLGSWARDFLTWRRWLRNRPDRLSPEELIEKLSKYRHDSFRIRLLREIGRRELLEPSGETESVLTSLAMVLESAPEVLIGEAASAERLRLAPAVLGLYDSRVGSLRWSVETLDEICKLERQIRERRPG